jgi:predicted ArsR family transcriptional regulator
MSSEQEVLHAVRRLCRDPAGSTAQDIAREAGVTVSQVLRSLDGLLADHVIRPIPAASPPRYVNA